MAITMNLYYTGKNGSAVRFAEEMVSSGTVEKIKNEADSHNRHIQTRFVSDK